MLDDTISHRFGMVVCPMLEEMKLLGETWVKKWQIWDHSTVFQEVWTYGVEEEQSTWRRTWQNGENQQC